MLIRTNWNRYDFFIIILIVSIISGEIGSPLMLTRIEAICLIPWIITSYKAYKIPRYISNFLIIWFAFSILSLLWTPNRDNGIKFLLYNILNACDLVGICMLSKKAKSPLKSIIFAWSIMFLLTMPIAIDEYYNSRHLPVSVMGEVSLRDGAGDVVQRKFASVTFGNLNTYSVIACFCLPFSLIAVFLYNRFKPLYILTYVCIAYVILMNASRGAFLCLVIATFLFVVYLLRTKIINRFTIIIILSVLTLLISQFGESLFAQIVYKTHYQGFDDPDRFNIYSFAWDIFVSTMTLGCGIGGLSNALAINGAIVAATHNLYLEFLVQYGLIPFLAFLNLCYKPALQLSTENHTYVRLLGRIFILYSIPLFIINSGYIPNPATWLFLGSIISFNTITQEKSAEHIIDQ